MSINCSITSSFQAVISVSSSITLISSTPLQVYLRLVEGARFRKFSQVDLFAAAHSSPQNLPTLPICPRVAQRDALCRRLALNLPLADSPLAVLEPGPSRWKPTDRKDERAVAVSNLIEFACCQLSAQPVGRPKICVRKQRNIRSHYAQWTGEFMPRKWQIYGSYASLLIRGMDQVRPKMQHCLRSRLRRFQPESFCSTSANLRKILYPSSSSL
jgi:hypothetical protein